MTKSDPSNESTDPLLSRPVIMRRARSLLAMVSRGSSLDMKASAENGDAGDAMVVVRPRGPQPVRYPDGCAVSSLLLSMLLGVFERTDGRNLEADVLLEWRSVECGR